MADRDKLNMVKARLLVLSEMFNELTDEQHIMPYWLLMADG